jgi:hypothetical protein
MLKKSSSFVLASLSGSTYSKEYAPASSLTGALLEGIFEHPVGYVGSVYEPQDVERSRSSIVF